MPGVEFSSPGLSATHAGHLCSLGMSIPALACPASTTISGDNCHARWSLPRSVNRALVTSVRRLAVLPCDHGGAREEVVLVFSLHCLSLRSGTSSAVPSAHTNLSLSHRDERCRLWRALGSGAGGTLSRCVHSVDPLEPNSASIYDRDLAGPHSRDGTSSKRRS